MAALNHNCLAAGLVIGLDLVQREQGGMLASLGLMRLNQL
jgi:hypothetical protein